MGPQLASGAMMLTGPKPTVRLAPRGRKLNMGYLPEAGHIQFPAGGQVIAEKLSECSKSSSIIHEQHSTTVNR